MTISPQRRLEILDALRRGTVPSAGLDVLAVGLDRYVGAIDEDLDRIANGAGAFKAIRGEYGSGKTFLTRWLAERAKARGMAASEVQVSESDTPIHRYQTVYRRLVEQLSTSSVRRGALRTIVDSWFFTLEDDVLATGRVEDGDPTRLTDATATLMESRLGEITRTAPAFSAVLRSYLHATNSGDAATADGLLAWLGGQPHVGASVKRTAGIKGDLDHDAALSFLAGLLHVLRDAGYPGLVVVLDEAETMQRMRSDTRDKGLEALRKLIDDLHEGRFPGLYLVMTGTPAFFDGPQGVQRLAPLAQRLHTEFGDDPRFDNPRAVQVRLPGFTLDSLIEVGRKVRDLFADGLDDADRVRERCDDEYLATLAAAVTGELGKRVGIAPRLYLRKLVDVLDRIELNVEFDPRRHYALTVTDGELTEVERNARAAGSVDDIELDL
ncbi:BREX system ATP-binding protein BrxD [Actinomarinicola tropica]|uniref:BREX system ATP-binding protein BrxD n=1 Tax=Actinomarinicola tropica TaxID=2789776 RepID=A0A5Q2RJY9_9ACTN|nr:BREX system ATP-binding protein BrxD [Actinomarinicola tropica]QGG94367.1 BREX system ATP-binding protein BrxD [Actinomarinicola tropica]